MVVGSMLMNEHFYSSRLYIVNSYNSHGVSLGKWAYMLLGFLITCWFMCVCVYSIVTMLIFRNAWKVYTLFTPIHHHIHTQTHTHGSWSVTCLVQWVGSIIWKSVVHFPVTLFTVSESNLFFGVYIHKSVLMAKRTDHKYCIHNTPTIDVCLI